MAIQTRSQERIRWSTCPSDIIGKYVVLKGKGKRGSMEWIGMCPFHKERTPSFTVTDRKNFYHCFGCGRHGRVHDFLMKKLGISYEAAMLEIADHYEIMVPCGPTKVTKKKLKDRARRLKRLERKERNRQDPF